MSKTINVEQMIRDILSALDDGLVIALESGDDPQGFTAGDLVAPANVLNAFLANIREEMMETNMNVEIHEDLRTKGKALILAALEFWRIHQKLAGPRAVVWLEDTSGHLIVFTRGEYRQQLLTNIHPLSGETPLEDPFSESDKAASNQAYATWKDHAYGGQVDAFHDGFKAGIKFARPTRHERKCEMPETLKPCPFCGEREDLEMTSGDGVACHGCEAYVPFLTWQHRTPGPATAALIAELRTKPAIWLTVHEMAILAEHEPHPS